MFEGPDPRGRVRFKVLAKDWEGSSRLSIFTALGIVLNFRFS